MKPLFPPRRILVAVDLSEPSLAALEAAKALSRRHGSRLDLVYVEEAPLSLMGFSPELADGRLAELGAQMEEFRRWREERILRRAAGVPPARLSVRTERGEPASELVKAARRGADLIVMGTHGRSGSDRVVFGSVAEAVVRRAEVPVLTVRPGAGALKLGRVLAPYNLRAYALDALDYAARLARRSGGRLTVLYVGDEGDWSPEERRRLRARLEPVVGAARLRLLVRPGDAPAELLAQAAGYDAVVLSAHRKRLGRALLLGSTAERLLRHSPSPVVSVP